MRALTVVQCMWVWLVRGSFDLYSTTKKKPIIAIKGYHFPSLQLVPWCQGMSIPLKEQRIKCDHYILNFFLNYLQELIRKSCQFIDTLP